MLKQRAHNSSNFIQTRFENVTKWALSGLAIYKKKDAIESGSAKCFLEMKP
jgi:hypothetical protein